MNWLVLAGKRKVRIQNNLYQPEAVCAAVTSSVDGRALLCRSSSFFKAAEASFGSYAVWKTDFTSTAKMRGVGWVICCHNHLNGRLSNHWVSLHEIGIVVGFTPLLVLDVWEPAFLLDYKPSEKPLYIEAFFSNIDGTSFSSVIEPPRRLTSKVSGRNCMGMPRTLWPPSVGG